MYVCTPFVISDNVHTSLAGLRVRVRARASRNDAIFIPSDTEYPTDWHPSVKSRSFFFFFHSAPRCIICHRRAVYHLPPPPSPAHPLSRLWIMGNSPACERRIPGKTRPTRTLIYVASAWGLESLSLLPIIYSGIFITRRHPLRGVIRRRRAFGRRGEYPRYIADVHRNIITSQSNPKSAIDAFCRIVLSFVRV